MSYLSLLIPFIGLFIPILAIILSHKEKTQKNNIRELELRKEIVALEIEKQNVTLRLLEEENKKYDNIINHAAHQTGDRPVQ